MSDSRSSARGLLGARREHDEGAAWRLDPGKPARAADTPALAVDERIVAASVENIEADLRVPVAHLVEQGCEREARALEHFFLARRHARHVARQEEVLPVDLHAMTREKHRRLIARLQAIEEKLPLAQEVGPSDIVGLLHIVAEADKRFADRLGIVDRLFQLLLFGKIVVGIDANHEGDALRGVRCGAGSERKQASYPKTATRMRAIAPSQASAGDRSAILSPAINGSKLNRG